MTKKELLKTIQEKLCYLDDDEIVDVKLIVKTEQQILEMGTR